MSGSRVSSPLTVASYARFALMLAVLTTAGCSPAGLVAGGILHPSRRPPPPAPQRPFDAVTWQGEGVRLEGWRFPGEGPIRRGTIVYMHGIADNRGSSLWIANHFVPLGYDVIAYDSRAHGASEGSACTYGVYEKQDLLRVLAGVEARPIYLFGISLGAAVSLQAAALTKDVAGVIAISTFSDLRAVVRDRTPWYLPQTFVEDGFRKAEAEANFRVDDASPLRAAPLITSPVLLIHGARDVDTPPAHSQRVYEALRAPKRLILVPAADHNDTLNGWVWPQIDGWLKSPT
jgi:pimeloyl-ACP methyl ester carboxylesterase